MKKLFFLGYLLFPALCLATYYSQSTQDQFIYDNYFKDLKNGTFVEIGAHNGISYSNTYFFEKELAWKGICIEPMPQRFAELKTNRNCICIQGCVSDTNTKSLLLQVKSPNLNTEMLSGLLYKYDPRHLERLENELRLMGGYYELIEVQCYLLNDLLEKNGIFHLNYLSIDTEGGEFDILSSIDFSKFIIDVITVEDNYEDKRFITFFEEKGYRFVTNLGKDLVFASPFVATTDSYFDKLSR